MGTLLENYYAIGHSSAANYVAKVSGQAPDLGTQADCPLWTPFPGDIVAGPYHQVPGEGCVYPATVPTLGNQLSGAGPGWAAYLQDMGNDPARDNTAATAPGPACGHPARGRRPPQRAERGDQYAAARPDSWKAVRSRSWGQHDQITRIVPRLIFSGESLKSRHRHLAVGSSSACSSTSSSPGPATPEYVSLQPPARRFPASRITRACRPRRRADESGV